MKFITEILILALIVIISAFAIGLLPGGENQGYAERLHNLINARLTSATGDDNGDDDVSARVEMTGGILAVRLPDNVRQQAGIVTGLPERTEQIQEFHVFGKAIDIQPLLVFRSGYNTVLSGKKIAEAALLASQQEYERLRILHEEASNISERQLEEAKARWLTDSARVQAERQKMEDLRNEAMQNWNTEIVNWAQEDAEIFRRLRSHEEILVLVTMGGDQQLPPGTEKIMLSHSGDRETAQEAYYIAPATMTDSLIQGETYYFHTRAENLRVGMRLDVWVTEDKTLSQGVTIPASAVIWYVDKPWVYIQRDDDTFVRQVLTRYREGREGWFVEDETLADARIVLQGGQMLLSEEFRWSIPDEDDNP